MKLSAVTIAAVVALSVIVAGCRREVETPPPAPVITLDSPTAIYTVKEGRQITIEPTFENVDNATTYLWLSESGEELGNEPSLNFSSAQVGRYYITLTVGNKGGSSVKELRIDVLALDRPIISLTAASDTVKVVEGSELTFSPTVASSIETTYLWQIDGNDLSTELVFRFPTDRKGTYRVCFSTLNDDGSDRIEFTVVVCSTDEVDFAWTFLTEEYNLSVGRTIRIAPVDIVNSADATYRWLVNDTEVQSGTQPEYRFEATTEGVSRLKVEMHNSAVMASHTLTVNVCPKEGHYRREATAQSSEKWNIVYEFLPAPGQFVNENYTATTVQQACDYAQGRMEQSAYVSLGAFGGYLVVGFDHSIANDGGYNIAITGNAYDGSSEPGIVWVMQDENGDGLPNDTWYELRGSEYGKPETWQDYAVTYYRPQSAKSAIEWSDNHNQRGTVDYLGSFHRQDSYYPLWVETESYTLRGTRLEARNHDKSGEGTYWVNDSFDWGYADNFSPIDRLTDDDNHTASTADNHFKIGDAVTFEGVDANLQYIDFVKIQVGVNAKSGWIGENSTEVFGIRDYNMLKKD